MVHLHQWQLAEKEAVHLLLVWNSCDHIAPTLHPLLPVKWQIDFTLTFIFKAFKLEALTALETFSLKNVLKDMTTHHPPPSSPSAGNILSQQDQLISNHFQNNYFPPRGALVRPLLVLNLLVLFSHPYAFLLYLNSQIVLLAILIIIIECKSPSSIQC